MISLLNCRSLCDDRYTPKGKVLRTGCILDLEKNDEVLLKDQNVKFYFDFRCKQELKNFVGIEKRFANCGIEWINYEIDVTQYNALISNPLSSNYIQYYIKILECGAESIKKFFEKIVTLQKEPKIVFGCSLGKDRTGIVSYLFLEILNAEKKDIYDDYEKTAKYLYEADDAVYCKNFREKKDISLRLNPNKKIIQGLEKYIKEQFGNSCEYLKSIGVSENLQKIIQNKWGNQNG